MMIELLDKSTLLLINKTLKYPLMTTEKDYFLALVSKIIYDSPLKDLLIFKGGTALHHTYLPQLRFSEDLDFSSNQKPLTLEELKAIFEPYEFLSVKKEYTSGATIKIERLLIYRSARTRQFLKSGNRFFTKCNITAYRNGLS
ncbi:MAG: nucleotidyl transferase AbiEii/AbiGii toxin family protein [Candidatus Magasanikbacteria bacterium]|nr:nucleotidyl transferase AbiEii/AbiGii toxin family protein [Candidatus Magasanikbacteria bacterium]